MASQQSPQDKRVQDGLTAALNGGRRIVWWEDPDGEFAEIVDQLAIPDAVVVKVGSEPSLALKKRIELEEFSRRFILYESQLPPEPEGDWLLDIRLYAQPFAADRTSMLLQELGLTQPSLRDYLKTRGRFFASKDRIAKLRRRLSPADDEAVLDLKIMAVIVKVEQDEWFAVLTRLLSTVAGEEDLEATELWAALSDYNLLEAFWSHVKRIFGYDEAEPSLWRFVIRLFATDLGYHLKESTPTALNSLLLPAAKAPNATVFLAKWRDSSRHYEGYDSLSRQVANELKPEELLNQVALEHLIDLHTFDGIEKLIAATLRDRVLSDELGAELAGVRGIAAQRQDGYWANARRALNSHDSRYTLDHYYDALAAATQLIELRQQYTGGFAFDSPEACFKTYAKELYRFDQLYRFYHEAAGPVEGKSSEVLAVLTDKIERIYLQGFLQPLSQAWDSFIGNGLLEKWQLPAVPNQYRFYDKFVRSWLNQGDDRRVFVLVSDALRYEIAQELEERINSRNYLAAELAPQLGVLPSYTTLGMASLLPHRALTYTEKGELLVDGQSTAGLEARNKVLAGHQGMAIKFDAFMALRKDEGRELFKGYRAIYIYHDAIDAVGDKQATEAATFEASRQAVNELTDAVGRAVNNFYANHLLITADHGFLYQESALVQSDKHTLEVKPTSAIKAKKRYIVGREMGQSDLAWCGDAAVTAGVADSMSFWVPRGLNRFHFVGGARFVHGGAALQEICVPVLSIMHKKGKGRAQTTTRKVAVTALGNNIKITTNQYRFTLLQTEPVAERVRPVTLKVGLYASDVAVSSEETITFDSASGDMNKRQRVAMLTLLNRPFSNKEAYHLKLIDTETGVEQYRMDVRIDLAFTNDFDF